MPFLLVPGARKHWSPSAAAAPFHCNLCSFITSAWLVPWHPPGFSPNITPQDTLLWPTNISRPCHSFLYAFIIDHRLWNCFLRLVGLLISFSHCCSAGHRWEDANYLGVHSSSWWMYVFPFGELITLQGVSPEPGRKERGGERKRKFRLEKLWRMMTDSAGSGFCFSLAWPAYHIENTQDVIAIITIIVVDFIIGFN